VFAAVGCAFLSSLGAWQVGRLHESEADRAAYAARLDEPAFDADAPPDDPADRRVRVTGTPRWDRYFLLAGKYMWSKPGYQLLVPVRTVAGANVVVNLGWIPADEVELILPNERAIPTPRTFEGIARVYPEDPDARGTFGEDDGYARRWRALSPRAMGAQAGVDVPGWIVVEGKGLGPDEDIPDRTPPIGGWRTEAPTRPHGEYAFTWFSLATTLFAVWLSSAFRPTTE
jgi:surfeit locus 1 family protein